MSTMKTSRNFTNSVRSKLIIKIDFSLTNLNGNICFELKKGISSKRCVHRITPTKTIRWAGGDYFYLKYFEVYLIIRRANSKITLLLPKLNGIPNKK